MTKREIASKMAHHSTLMLEASAGESDAELLIESARVELAASALRRHNREAARRAHWKEYNVAALIRMACGY